MTHKRIVAALALAFALGIGISFVNLSSEPNASASENLDAAETATPVEADPETSADDVATPADDSVTSSDITVTTAEEFIAAVNNSSVNTITLGENIVASVNINRSTPLTIDLKNHQITPSDNYTIKLSHGDLTITGNGTISATNNNIVVNGSTSSSDKNYSTLTVNEGVTLYSQNAYAIAVMPYNAAAQQYQAYGVTVNMNGIAEGGYGLKIIQAVRFAALAGGLLQGYLRDHAADRC